MKAAIMVHDALAAGTDRVALAGGFESMSRAPYLLDRAREGYRMGNAPIYDHMNLDGLQDGFGDGRLMGCFAEECATAYEFSRSAQDEYALESLRRARSDGGRTFAAGSRLWRPDAPGDESIELDEQPRRGQAGPDPNSAPAFAEGSTVTAASSELHLGRGRSAGDDASIGAERRGLSAKAVVVAHASRSKAVAVHDRARRGGAQVLDKAGWSIAEVDLFEINEAFAVVPMAAMFDLGLPYEAQRARRRLRPRPSCRRFWGAHPRDPHERAGEVRPQARRRQPLHRRWRGYGDGYRALELRPQPGAIRPSNLRRCALLGSRTAG
jgi:acetyl-CoA C-acetyltransferase